MKIWVVYYKSQSYNFFTDNGIKVIGIFQTEQKAYDYLRKLEKIQELSEKELESTDINPDIVYEIGSYELDFQLYSDEELENVLKRKNSNPA